MVWACADNTSVVTVYNRERSEAGPLFIYFISLMVYLIRDSAHSEFAKRLLFISFI